EATRKVQPHPQGSMVKGPIVAIAIVLLAALALSLLVFVRQQEHRDNYRFQQASKHYAAATAQAVERLQNGESIRDLAVLPAPPAAAIISTEAMPVMAAGLAFGALLLILALGFRSIRTIRNSN